MSCWRLDFQVGIIDSAVLAILDGISGQDEVTIHGAIGPFQTSDLLKPLSNFLHSL
jgi:hypothetical protein